MSGANKNERHPMPTDRDTVLDVIRDYGLAKESDAASYERGNRSNDAAAAWTDVERAVDALLAERDEARKWAENLRDEYEQHVGEDAEWPGEFPWERPNVEGR
jgi:hypothetical protein